MGLVEFKSACRIEKDGREIKAFAHVIEVRYDERFVFWNVVLQLTEDEIVKLGTIGPPSPVGVCLDDGRKGFLFLTHINMDFRGEGHNEIAGVGKPSG